MMASILSFLLVSETLFRGLGLLQQIALEAD